MVRLARWAPGGEGVTRGGERPEYRVGAGLIYVSIYLTLLAAGVASTTLSELQRRSNASAKERVENKIERRSVRLGALGVCWDVVWRENGLVLVSSKEKLASDQIIIATTRFHSGNTN